MSSIKIEVFLEKIAGLIKEIRVVFD